MSTDPRAPHALPDPIDPVTDPDEVLDDAARGVSGTSDETPDSADDPDEIDAIGDAAGYVVPDDKPLPSGDPLERRDEHRWELDPASAERPADD